MAPADSPPHSPPSPPTRDIRGPNIPDDDDISAPTAHHRTRHDPDHSSQDSLAGRLIRSVSARRTAPGAEQGVEEADVVPDLPNQPRALEDGGAVKRLPARQRTLVRPERSRIAQDPNSPYYYTANRAAAMHAAARSRRLGGTTATGGEGAADDAAATSSSHADVLRRRTTVAKKDADKEKASKRVSKLGGSKDKKPRQSAWTLFSKCVTCYVPASALRRAGMPLPGMQQAWREKVALVTIIILMCAAVGFLTFGFQQVLCGIQGNRIKGGPFLDRDYVAIHGKLYNIAAYKHPLVTGITNQDLRAEPTNGGGKDLSFRFQLLNSHCKDVIIPNEGQGDANGGVYNYFPCSNVDAWSTPNPYDNMARWGCHDTATARRAVSRLKYVGDLYYDWDELRDNKKNNFIVYDGSVLDMNRMLWFVPFVTIPPEIMFFANNTDYRGKDASLKLSSTAAFKAAGQCMLDTLKIGYIEFNSVGCIISNMVLYVSLFVIVAVVMIKFFLAVLFGWVLSWKLGTVRETTLRERQQRAEAIEAWSEDIMNGMPRARPGTSGGPGSVMSAKNRTKSFLPTSSRFTMPLPGDEPGGRHGANARTVSMFDDLQLPGQILAANLAGGGSARSRASSRNSVTNSPHWNSADPLGGGYTTPLDPYPQMSLSRPGTPRAQDMLSMPSEMNMARSSAFLELPPAVTQLPVGSRMSSLITNAVNVSTALNTSRNPFDFPLAHTFMVVTCYSEGVEGLRTTLDSLALSDYPSTHKLLLVIADGMIVGHGNEMSTPDICISMMRDFLIPPELVEAHSYVAIADGTKRHNKAKVYAGYYKYDDAAVPTERQQRVPMITIVKCGGPEEQGKPKAGNRGKRDSQIILMSFLQRVMFDERMTELEYEFFNAIWNLSGVPPDVFEIVLMVDADTKVFPDAVTRMVSVFMRDPLVMGLCGETKIANKSQSWVTMIQVFEYYISHHLNKAFESIFGGVTCLPGCFCMYRVKAPKGPNGYWVPILANPDIVEHYAENVVDTLHKKNLLLLGEDRYLSTLMLRTFPKRKMLFVPQAVCKTVVPDTFRVLLSQRRRWINSTVHNLLELVLLRDLCGIFCFSMQFVIFMELVGTVVLPAAITFTIYLVIISFFTTPVPVIPLVLLAAILGLPAILILMTTRRIVYVGWMLIYLLSLPIWNFALPVYAFWHFDDFSWGATRLVQGEDGKGHGDKDGEFDSSHITMKRWCEFERDKRKKAMALLTTEMAAGATAYTLPQLGMGFSSANDNPFAAGSIHLSHRNSLESETAGPDTSQSNSVEGPDAVVSEIGYAAPSTLASVVAEYETVNPSLAALRGSTIISTPQGVFALPPPIMGSGGSEQGISMVPKPPSPSAYSPQNMGESSSDVGSSTAGGAGGRTLPRSGGDGYKRSQLGR